MAVKRVTRAKRASVGQTSAAAGCWGGCWYGACWGGCWPGLRSDPRVVDAFLDLIATDTVHLPLPTKDQGQKPVPARPDEPVQTAA